MHNTANPLLKKAYMEQLVKWQIEDRAIDCCYSLVKTIDEFDEISEYTTPAVYLPEENDVRNWMFGYCKINDLTWKKENAIFYTPDHKKIERERLVLRKF